MPHCGYSNAIPSCPATPSVGFGSGCSGFGSGLGYGYYGANNGGTASAASLGVLTGADPRCIVQLRPQEATIQPPPVVVTVPGCILSATPEPLKIGGYAPCAHPGSGSGFRSGRYGYGYLGSRCDNLGLGHYGLGFGSLGDLSYRNHGYFGGYGSSSRRGSLCIS